MQQTFKTPKGTELPMLDLRGKPYLQVAHRLVWFREEHPDWSIQTEMVEKANYEGSPIRYAIFRASIIMTKVPRQGSIGYPDIVLATATGQESSNDFPDYIEKAETKAIGRALAMCGYGTQFAPELDEGERLADAPVAPARNPMPKATKTKQLEALGAATVEQKKRIAELAVQKLAANPNDGKSIIDSLNAEFHLNLTSSDDLTHNKAKVLIAAMEAKPDFQLPYDHPQS